MTPEERRFLLEVARRNRGLEANPPSRAERLDEPAARLRWRRWLRFGGGNDWRLLRRRMLAEGLRPGAVYQPRAAASLPDWAKTLHGLRRRAQALAGQTERLPGLLPPGALALPFADLLAPCLLLGRERLAARRRHERDGVLAGSVEADLERALLRRLGEVLGPCLLALFDRERRIAPISLALFSRMPDPPREAYRAFVAGQLATAWRALGERWPVALRLMAELVEQWAEAGAEFLDRLTLDHPELCRRFFPAAPPGPVTALAATLSDPHAGGRVVLELVFEHGGRLIYKPRPMAMEAIFSRTLDWFNGEHRRRHPEHRVAKVLDRGEYGWMEWIAAEAMASGEAEAYHWRLGSLMALYRALRGIDMHHENLIAAGAQPVFVDVECLLHPSFAPFLAQADTNHAERLPRELLAMGLLPQYAGGIHARRYVNLGGIGKTAEAPNPRLPAFIQVNSDCMTLSLEPQPDSTHHQPRDGAGWVNSLAHATAIAAGYRQTLAALLPRREWLLGDEFSPWAGLVWARGRHLARDTWHYGLLMTGAMSPEALADGIMFDLGFDALHRHLHQLAPAFRAMVPAERRDLRRLDVPRFGFAAADTRLFDARGEPLGEAYPHTPFQTMAAGLRALTPERADWEADLLERLLAEHAEPVDTGLAALVADLRRRHRAGPSGAQLWLGLGLHGERLRVHPLAPGLYLGSAGVALALAAAARVLASEDDARLAGATLKETLSLISPPGLDQPGSGQPGPGYDQGMAGLLHALHWTGRLNGDPELVDGARDLALDWLAEPERRLQPDTPLDLLNGVAGLILVLLQLHRHHPQALGLLWAARAGGDHLLRQALPEAGGLALPEAGGLAWSGPAGHGLSGLSHGGSGFALALAALYRATGHGPYRDAAFAALDHEARLFDPEQGNWRDLRGYTGGDIATVQNYGCSWCHGAPGIALARAGLLTLLADDLTEAEGERLNRDLDVALATTRRALALDQGPLSDDLCCGTAGRIDILLECGRLLDRPELRQQARHEAARRRARWSEPDSGQRPRYWFAGTDLAGTDLSLFKGIAGQVYLQARLADPDTVPCVLLPL